MCVCVCVCGERPRTDGVHWPLTPVRVWACISIGPIPAVIGQLTHCRVLHMNENRLSGRYMYEQARRRRRRRRRR